MDEELSATLLSSEPLPPAPLVPIPGMAQPEKANESAARAAIVPISHFFLIIISFIQS
jgi:hypothetical protein